MAITTDGIIDAIHEGTSVANKKHEKWSNGETPRATSMAPVGVSRTKIPPYPPATASRGVPAPMSWRIGNDSKHPPKAAGYLGLSLVAAHFR